jgi:PilZ domain-containing protein
MAEPADRRAAERFPVNANTSCNFLSPVLEDFGSVRIKNISNEGIGLIVTEKLQPGLLLAVGLINTERQFNKTLLVRVMHVTAQPGGTFLVGGSFVNPLTYDELKTMVM